MPDDHVGRDRSGIADQLKKLHDLLESGVITRDDFEQAKKKLLGPHAVPDSTVGSKPIGSESDMATAPSTAGADRDPVLSGVRIFGGALIMWLGYRSFEFGSLGFIMGGVFLLLGLAQIGIGLATLFGRNVASPTLGGARAHVAHQRTGSEGDMVQPAATATDGASKGVAHQPIGSGGDTAQSAATAKDSDVGANVGVGVIFLMILFTAYAFWPDSMSNTEERTSRGNTAPAW